MQGMRCCDIIKTIEKAYPVYAACEWDNVGLLVGNKEKEIKSIYVALDATDEIIQTVVNKKIDMLITHHPLIYSPLQRITNEHFVERRVFSLIQHDISYYAMHTNYDVLGMADLAGEMMGMANSDVLEVTRENGVRNKPEGIGRICTLEEAISLRQCCEMVKERFQLEHVKVFGDLNQLIKRLAISPGSGKSMIDISVLKGADVLITGDIDHHSGIDAVAQGMAVIDAGHYGLEHIFIQDMLQFLQKNFETLQIESAPVAHPFQMV